MIKTNDIRCWADMIWDIYGGLRVVPESQEPFSGRLTCREFDHLKAVELRHTAQSMHRTAAMVASHPTDDMFVALVVDGSCLIVQDGRTAVVNAGEFALVDSTRPYTSVLKQSGRVIDYSWPRADFGLAEKESFDLTARTICSDSPMGKFLSPMLLHLYEMDKGLSAAGAVRLESGIADLVVTAALELSRPGLADARSRKQYDDMVRHIDRHLEDPALSAETIAAAVFVSTRTVHRIFARYGTSVAAVIRDRRLEACRQMMLSPSHRGQSISYLVSQFGFSSLQVFSRMFTAKYGMAPKRYRDTRTRGD